MNYKTFDVYVFFKIRIYWAKKTKNHGVLYGLKNKKMFFKKVVKTIAHTAKCTFNKTKTYFLENIL